MTRSLPATQLMFVRSLNVHIIKRPPLLNTSQVWLP